MYYTDSRCGLWNELISSLLLLTIKEGKVSYLCMRYVLTYDPVLYDVICNRCLDDYGFLIPFWLDEGIWNAITTT
jgi:hypothetical protein